MFPTPKGFIDSFFLLCILASSKYSPNSPIPKPFRFKMEVDSRLMDEQ
jgi:hypothetical protein